MQNFEVKQKAIAQIAHRPGAQLESSLSEKLVTNFLSLLSSQVACQTDIYYEIVAKPLTGPNNSSQCIGFYHRMKRVRGTFLLNLQGLEQTLGVCGYRSILRPDHFERGLAYSTVVGFGNKIDARKMVPFRHSCSGYFSRRPTRLFGD